jgi:hypothetical protein
MIFDRPDCVDKSPMLGKAVENNRLTDFLFLLAFPSELHQKVFRYGYIAA